MTKSYPPSTTTRKVTAKERALRGTWWTTNKGQRIQVFCMSDSHLINACLFLEELYEGHIQREALQVYASYSTVQGEMAQYYYEQYMSELGTRADIQNEELFEDVRYRAMRQELELRGIDYDKLFEDDVERNQ